MTTLQEFLLTQYETQMIKLGTLIEDVKDVFAEVLDKVDSQDPDNPLTSLLREHTHYFALAEVVAMHTRGEEHWAHACGYCGDEGQGIDCTYPCDTLRILAMPFVGLEGFDPAWAINPEYFERQSLLSSKDLIAGLEDYAAGRVEKA